MACDDDLLDVGKPGAVTIPLQQLIESVKRRHAFPVWRVLVHCAAGPGSVGPHKRGARVAVVLLLAILVIGEGFALVVTIGKEGSDHGNGIHAHVGVRLGCLCQRQEHAGVVVLRIPAKAVADNDGAADGLIGRTLPRTIE